MVVLVLIGLLGFVQEQEKKPTVIADYDQVITIGPQNVFVYYNHGSTRVNLDGYAEAIAKFGDAIPLNPPFADAYNNRGMLQQLDRMSSNSSIPSTLHNLVSMGPDRNRRITDNEAQKIFLRIDRLFLHPGFLFARG